MNKLLIIVAVTLFLRPVLPVIGYIINYDHVVKELCENRTNTALNCNGKCQLKKELAKASGANESTGERKLKLAEQELLFINPIEEISFTNHKPNILKISDRYCYFYNYNSTNNIFHPPLL